MWYTRTPMQHFPRGIAPELLISQIKNTMPYLFSEGDPFGDALARNFPPAAAIRAIAAKISPGESVAEPLTHFEYFRLCLFAHLLTVGTPVPTDVDNQIRLKLWPQGLPLETALALSALIREARGWDFRLVSPRFTRGAAEWSTESVSGHLGEWFTVAAAAYGALGRYIEPEAGEERARVFAAIFDEIHRHSEIFGSLWRAGEGRAALTASASVSHNFGDLDRVMDMWELPPQDPLKLEGYKLGVIPIGANGKLRHKGRLWVAGELYKAAIGGSAMALENHRHFALRKPRALRSSPELMIPTGPFFDDWGMRVARALATPSGAPSDATYEVIDALKHGWNRLPATVGYGRALLGIRSFHPEISLDGLERIYRAPAVLGASPEAFARQWSDAALVHLDEIPSRA